MYNTFILFTVHLQIFMSFPKMISAEFRAKLSPIRENSIIILS